MLMEDRDYSIDFIRVIACYMIVLFHIHRWNLLILNFLPVSTHLFVMITGYFIFNKNYNNKEILLKGIKKIIIPTIIFVVITLNFSNWFLNKSSLLSCFNNFNIFLIFKNLPKILLLDFSGIDNYELYENLWYIKFYSMVLLLYPFFKTVCSKKTSSSYRKFIITCFIFNILLRTLSGLGIVKIDSMLPFNSNDYIYLLLGYELSLSNKKLLNGSIKNVGLGIIFIIFGFIIQYSICRYLTASNSSNLYYYMNSECIFSVFSTVGMFILFGNIGKKLYKFKNIINWLSNKTFGIYLIHYIITFKLKKMNTYNIIEDKLGSSNLIFNEIIYAFLIFMICLIIIVIIKNAKKAFTLTINKIKMTSKKVIG